MSALSALLAGGGGGCFVFSRSSSPDLRGGGGDGGCELESLGDLPGSRMGVVLRLGILNGLLGTDGVVGAVLGSGLRSVWESMVCVLDGKALGGESGGSTIKAGVLAGC